MNPRFPSLTRTRLALVGFAALALGAASIAGAACTTPPTSIGPGTGGGGAGGAGGGGGSGGAVNQGHALFSDLDADFYMACGSCHDVGGIADTPFLAGPDHYQSITSWPGMVVKDPAKSKLLTYPVAGPQHPYKKLDSAEYKDTLMAKIQAWLTEEAKNIVADAPDAGKYIDPFAPIMGFNAVYLDALGAEYTGMALTFTASELDPKTLQLDDLEVHPTGSLGVHLVHPLFLVHAAGKAGNPDPVDSFSNVDQYFQPSESGTLGPGTLILTNWIAGAKLSVAFEKIEPVTPQGMDDGGTEGGTTGKGCKDVASFTANTQPLLQQNCAGCHGGSNPQAQGAVDMSALGSDPATACAQVKNRVIPADPASSQLFITTDPGGNAAHPFKFGGSAGKFDAFKSSVSKWISAEQ